MSHATGWFFPLGARVWEIDISVCLLTDVVLILDL